IGVAARRTLRRRGAYRREAGQGVAALQRRESLRRQSRHVRRMAPIQLRRRLGPRDRDRTGPEPERRPLVRDHAGRQGDHEEAVEPIDLYAARPAPHYKAANPSDRTVPRGASSARYSLGFACPGRRSQCKRPRARATLASAGLSPAERFLELLSGILTADKTHAARVIRLRRGPLLSQPPQAAT